MRFALILLLTTTAYAETRVAVQPARAKPGDAVLVTVTGAPDTPRGDAGGKALHFFRARGGYQAVFAIPLDATEDVSVEIDSAKRTAHVAVRGVTFPESKLYIEDEYANPPAQEGKFIDRDNGKILHAMTNTDAPRFTKPFRRPPGAVTSTFGEWRTFNDGHRSQHLGLDVAAREGAPVHAVNDGVVTLVADTYLAGNVVVVSHGGGIASAYFHLDSTSVAEGDAVHAGQELGRAGQTGRTTGPHLHVSIRVPGGLVDPATFFKLRIAPSAPTS
jgi:murein DD-endopeptidase MepM/ murein hydrolase activator NlpD